MIFTEITGDLFDNVQDRVPVHCISQDCKMGKGIALPMKKKYNLDFNASKYPDCIYYNGVLNLITKKRYFDKPTYQTLTEALKIARDICMKQDITRLAMPRIGCGLDLLHWGKVKVIIKEVFQNDDIDILVCSL